MSNIEDLYILGKELGKGAFSVVRLCTSKKTGQKLAVKIIDKEKAKAPQDQKRLQTEVEILRKVSHPNIVSLKDMIESSSNLYLIMELVEGGELFDKIVEKGSYSEKDASTIVGKLLSAVAYLHDLNIAHRDLKPENLLLRKENDTDIMLSDFGLSKFIDQGVLTTACGTPYYVAPEVLMASGSYGIEVDLWSVGVITYLLLCGFPPFYGDAIHDVFEKIMKADFDFPDPYWTDVSPAAKDLIKKLLVVEPSERLSAKQCLEVPWIKNGGPNTLLKVQNKLVAHNSARKLANQMSDLKIK